MTSSGAECDNLRRRVLDKTALGDLAVPEFVDVRPLLLERTASRLDEASLVTQYDDRVALCDELTRLEMLELERFPDQGEKLCDALLTVTSAGPRDHGGAGQAPLHVVGQEA